MRELFPHENIKTRATWQRMTTSAGDTAGAPDDAAGRDSAGALDLVAAAVPWVARIAWVLVAIVGGLAVESAVDARSTSVRWTAAILGWGTWGVIALALAVGSTATLTLVRVGVPLALAAAVVTAVCGVPAADVAQLAGPAAVATLAALSAEFGRRYVQASAYGDEQRFPLRAPAAAGLAAIVVWFAWAAAFATGPFLLAAQQWVVGGVITAVALAGIALFGPRWHRLSRRWFVLVPAGAVVHDPVVLADTLALRTDQIASLHLAPADTGAADLTGPASGYAIEVATTESVTAVFAFTPREPNGRAIHLRAFLVAPSRPGAALRAARDRGLPVA